MADKSCKIRFIVMLRQKLRSWRTRARGSAAVTTSSSSPAPADVPEGHLAVCVGSGRRRFVVRASHLNHPAFRELLIEAEEEYGFSHSGPLSLPCEESIFLQILHRISSSYASLFPDARGKGSRRADKFPLLYTENPIWYVAANSHSSPITRSEHRAIA
ncbi:auxin-responsive protein SAUR50-like [Dendrobium catenatum]|uniref:Auxin-induced protein 6B n=1 Tax=Dendrobium catenatum TaxID=906689 RepID=A0A2I0V8V7_9ASPA|nr:auxin-responsive protein SAUR50-like [Dendrobium catenatum]PKU59845.1 Auxin-induced protein 6B [Dendrobium catenatum]